MTQAGEDYDIDGMHGAEVFRDLPIGLLLQLADGATGRIIGNPGDGAFVVVEIVDDPNDANRVGEEDTVFFSDVEAVVGGPQEGRR